MASGNQAWGVDALLWTWGQGRGRGGISRVCIEELGFWMGRL